MGLVEILIIIVIASIIYLTILATIHMIHMEDIAREKSGNDFMFNYIKQCEDMVKKIVFETDVIFVKALKEKDEFDFIAKKRAYDRTKNRFISIMGKDAIYVINSAVADFDEWIKIQIESVVAQR